MIYTQTCVYGELLTTLTAASSALRHRALWFQVQALYFDLSVSGALVDKFHNYDVPYIFGGVILLLMSLILLTLCLILDRRERSAAKIIHTKAVPDL